VVTEAAKAQRETGGSSEHTGRAEVTRQVDAERTWKPYQVMYEVIKALRELESGSILEVTTRGDEGLLNDLRTWSEVTGHTLIASQRQADDTARSLIRKGEPQSNDHRMTVVISTASLEHVVYPLDKALAGSVLGMEVNVVFEGACVRLLQRGYRAKLSGVVGRIFTPMVERVMKREIGWPLPQASILILEDLGAHFYACGPSMFGYGVRKEELMVEPCTIAAVVTWADLLSRSDIQVFSKAQFEKP